jgi:hypothetical protein
MDAYFDWAEWAAVGPPVLDKRGGMKATIIQVVSFPKLRSDLGYATYCVDCEEVVHTGLCPHTKPKGEE